MKNLIIVFVILTTACLLFAAGHGGGAAPSRRELITGENTSRKPTRNPDLDLTPEQLASHEGHCLAFQMRIRMGITPEQFEESRTAAANRVRKVYQNAHTHATNQYANTLQNGDWLDRAAGFTRLIGKNLRSDATEHVVGNIDSSGNVYFMSLADDQLASDHSSKEGSETLRKKISEVLQRHHEATHELVSPAVAISLLSPYFGNDPMRTIAALASATQADADMAIDEGKDAGVTSSADARRQFNQLTRYLRTPQIDQSPDPHGDIYHYWGFMAKQLVDSRELNALMKLSTGFFETDDTDERTADNSGRGVAIAIMSGMQMRGSPRQLHDICALASCAVCD